MYKIVTSGQPVVPRTQSLWPSKNCSARALMTQTSEAMSNFKPRPKSPSAQLVVSTRPPHRCTRFPTRCNQMILTLLAFALRRRRPTDSSLYSKAWRGSNKPHKYETTHRISGVEYLYLPEGVKSFFLWAIRLRPLTIELSENFRRIFKQWL